MALVDFPGPGDYEIEVGLAAPGWLIPEIDRAIDKSVNAGRFRVHATHVETKPDLKLVFIRCHVEERENAVTGPTTEAVPLLIVVGAVLALVSLGIGYSVHEIRQLNPATADRKKDGKGFFDDVQLLLILGIAGLAVYGLVRRG